MKILIFCFLFILTNNIMGQIDLSIKNCYFNGKNICVTIQIDNNTENNQQIEIDSSNLIVQIPYNPKGNEFFHRYNTGRPQAFIQCYVNDTLIREFKYHGIGIPIYTRITIPPKSSIERDYIVYVIGDKTRSLLEDKCKDVSIQFFLVYKLNGDKNRTMSEKMEVAY